MSIDMQMRRLTTARNKIQEINQRRMKLEGELEVHHKNLAELEKRSREEFDCEVDDLADVVDKLAKEGEEAVAKAEKLLGIQ
jgi:archaellum component FlaC